MCLRDADLPSFVASGDTRITQALEVPALKYCAAHDRISGFWQLSWLRRTSDGLRTFVLNRGRMRLLIGLPVHDTYDELIVASRNLESGEYRERVREEFFRQFWENPAFHDQTSRDTLEQLIASDSMGMRILPEVGRGGFPEHGKLQIYYDECQPPCWVQCIGSKNDSNQGDYGGADFMAVNRSWRSDPELQVGFEAYFQEKWTHPNAVGLGEKGTVEVLRRLRAKPQELRANRTEVIAQAMDLVASLAGLQGVVIGSAKAHSLLENARNAEADVDARIGVRPVSDPRVLVVASQLIETPRIAICHDSPAGLSEWKRLWDGPSVRSWTDLTTYDDLEAVESGRGTRRAWADIVEALALEPGERDEPPLYAYHHPAGLQPHQESALNLWESRSYRACFEHATGTYKTATGLTAAARLLTTGNSQLVVITTPQIAIAENWYAQACRDFDHPTRVRVLRCWSEFDDWRDFLDVYADDDTPVVAVFVNDSLWRSSTWKSLKAFDSDWSLVADEVHNWVGSQEALTFFHTAPQPVGRLGLSAQIADPRDQEKADQIVNWFTGSIDLGVHRFGLAEAIAAGFLRQYDYAIEPIELHDGHVDSGPLPTVADVLRMYETTKQDRTVEVAAALAKQYNRVLLYTGPRIDDARDLAGRVRDAVPPGAGYAVETFTSAESTRERRRILADFRKGLTKVLVAVRCLDEGVDLPIADAAVICRANEDERQWIQRRGRLLRITPGGEGTTAMIVDFVPQKKPGMAPELASEMERFADSEVRRAVSFSELARLDSRAAVIAVVSGLGW